MSERATHASEDEPGAPPASDLTRPRRRIGRYVVLYPLGEGGMGKVYAAHDPHLDRRVALKVMRPRKRGSLVGARERILAEAQALARLSHPNVVAVHDVGIVGDELFLALDLVEGLTLRRWWQRSPRPWPAIVEVFRQAARGLAAAHAAGIVHRDFKPDNAIVGNDGRVQVFDFGLAEAWNELEALESSQRIAASSSSSTSSIERPSPQRRGTPSYMAPEQHLGAPVGPAADQFALCVSLYEALYDRLPFEGTGEALVVTVTHGKFGDPPRDRRVPAWLRAAVLRGLAVDPERRHPSMAALVRALRPPRRSPARVGVGVGLVTALGLLGTWAATMPPSSPEAVSACPNDDLARPWTTEARFAVRRALLQSGRAHAEHTADRVVAELDAYAHDWLEADREACTHAAWTRRDCLVDRERQLRALVDRLQQPDAITADHAVRAIARLPRIDTCPAREPLRTAATLSAEHTTPSSYAGDQLARAAAELGLGRSGESLTLSGAVLERARVLEDAVLLTAAALLHGEGLAARGELERAAVVLREAALAAERIGDDDAVLEARIALVRVLGARAETFAEAELWSGLARATLARIGGDPLRESALEHGLALADLARGRPADALVHVHEALTGVEAGTATHVLHEAEIQHTLARALAAAGHPREALEAAMQALTRMGEVLGPNHPDLDAIEATITRIQIASTESPTGGARSWRGQSGSTAPSAHGTGRGSPR